jgi:hypothetical protein
MVAPGGNHNQTKGHLVRSTLAIYITLSAVAVVAVAQILYFKLVIARDTARAEDTSEATPLADGLAGWPEIAVQAAELRRAAETTFAAAEARSRSAAERMPIAA